MPITLTIRDQQLTGPVVQEMQLEVLNERLSVRDLIRQRVHQEVSLYNLSTPGCFRGLVQPNDAEATLNGYQMRQRRQIDWEQQADLAIQAFESNAFFILVDDRQVESLDQVIEIAPQTQIAFIRLVPLVGG